MHILNLKQNSDEWFKERKGNIGGSRVSGVLTDKIVNKTTTLKIILDERIEGIEDKKEIATIKKALSSLSTRELESMLPKEKYDEFFYEGMKKDYYRLMAEQMGYEDDPDEDPRDRGHRLEDKAAEKLEEKLSIKTIKVGMCKRDDYSEIYVSPDRLITSRMNTKVDGKTKKITVYTGGVEIKCPGVVNHLEIIFTNKVPSEYWDQVLQYFVVDDEMEYLYFVSYNPIVNYRPLVILKVLREDVQAEVTESYNNQVVIINHLKQDILSLSF